MGNITKIVTLERHINEIEHLHPTATGHFSNILRDLSLA
ncbi:MAG TPA: fructose-bisphosphatase class I, partial [Bacteroidetes bacterium]|nr:fructose-bisphosphatase class I [Bacteroidota bacterium]